MGDLDHGKARLGIKRHAPGFFELLSYRRVIDPLVIGVDHGDET